MLLWSAATSPPPVFVRRAANDVAERGKPDAERRDSAATPRGRELLQEDFLHVVAMELAQFGRHEAEKRAIDGARPAHVASPECANRRVATRTVASSRATSALRARRPAGVIRN